MATVIGEMGQVELPHGIDDIDSFRHWQNSEDFPEHGRIWWLCGKVWADINMEQVFTHVRVKTVITSVLDALANRESLGLVLGDGLALSNFGADISGRPDATFIASQTLQSDRIRLLEGAEGGFIELQGTPDMVLEVVSKSSVHKDTVTLRRAYWEAGIPEYWLVDARGDVPAFDILRHAARGYVASRKRDGWIKSAAFDKEFRFLKSTTALGHPDFRLEVR
jgi:Uma2 family endonuclease